MLGSGAGSTGAGAPAFAAGAALGSALWFTVLAAASTYAARWLRSRRAWRVLDAIIAVVMGVLAVALALA